MYAGYSRNLPECPTVSVVPTVPFNPATLEEAMELVEFAFLYDQIMYCFEFVDRGQFEVRYDPLESAHCLYLRLRRRECGRHTATQPREILISNGQRGRQSNVIPNSHRKQGGNSNR